MDDSKRENARAEHKQLFRQERSASRALMIQYLYSCEARQSWSATPEELDAFFEMAQEVDEQIPAAALKGAVKRARKLLPQLCEAVPQLDELIAKSSDNWTPQRIARLDLEILRLGAFESLYVPDLNAATAIDEAVELAKVYGQSKESPHFINGVLDKIKDIAAKPQP